ncbi:hypothetical protein CAPTEDRAFT_120867 [Capitella teleta]|uniref:G-protein coupled receptors family 1 profile domain-containing protein n=1 Tax=Capitella teleta TaxID=283909 RepID=R7TT79_CAPTE|nr:hypothetical protein CAPTEDRAFT_120867 [Capitella teleta]|eukprot:ELT96844.1 hypothetical protein CAPTEDRAFT_120867 [Capitella teleta]
MRENYTRCELGVEHFVHSGIVSALWILLIATIVTSSVVGNGLVIVSVWRERRLHCTQNVLYVNLAVSDFLTGLLVVPSMGVYMLHNCLLLGVAAYRVYIVGFGVFMSASYLTICGISLERFLVVRFPFMSRKCETRPYKTTFIVTSWVVPLITWVLIMTCCQVDSLEGVYVVRMPVAVSYTVTSLIQYGPLCAMLTLYVALLQTLKGNYRKESRTLQRNIAHEPSSYSAGGMFPHTDLKKRFSVRRHLRAARLLGALIVAFVACWLPWSLVWPIYTSRQASIPHVAVKITLTLSYLNSAINPFLYAFMSNDFRKAVHRLFRCACLTNSQKNFVSSQKKTSRKSMSKVKYHPNEN